jgi:hypothetical protein
MICWATLATLGFPSRSYDAQILQAFITMRGKSRVHMMRGILAEVTVGAKAVPSSAERLGIYQISPAARLREYRLELLGWRMVRYRQVASACRYSNSGSQFRAYKHKDLRISFLQVRTF